MTRHILLASALLLSTTAQAEECFLKSDMSFASALRSISTITLPSATTEATVYSGPKVTVRAVKPAVLYADAEPAVSSRTVRPQARQVSGGTYRPQ